MQRFPLYMDSRLVCYNALTKSQRIGEDNNSWSKNEAYIITEAFKKQVASRIYKDW